MADPFSVTGSAVGVVSLAIQICKGLVWYIDSARGAKDKVSHISSLMEKLTDLLELLESVIGKLDGSISGSATKAGIEACAEALEQIKRRLAGSSRTGDSKFRQQLKLLKHRLSFPFKQDDIMFWKDMVEGIQQNLHTALLALQM
jgi:hypothetical protein